MLMSLPTWQTAHVLTIKSYKKVNAGVQTQAMIMQTDFWALIINKLTTDQKKYI